MADKDLRRRTTPVFPRTRSSANDATSRSDYDLENRLVSEAGTDPLVELERLVGEIDSFAKTRTDAERGSRLNAFDAKEVTSRHRDDPGTRTNAAPDQCY